MAEPAAAQTAHPASAAITADGLEKRFAVPGWRPGRPRAWVEALRGLDLDVRAGAVHGLIGPNGSGKSTLLRILATLIIPDRGSASVDGLDALASPVEVRRRIGFSTGEERSVYWRLTARQNLEFAAALHRLNPPEPRIAEALAHADLSDEADRPVSGFSQGMARRLGLARALLHAPRILLLDEPTRSLDPVAREQFHEVLLGLRDRSGVTVLMATHDMGEAATICDEVSVLVDGRIVEHGPPGDAEALEAALRRGDGSAAA